LLSSAWLNRQRERAVPAPRAQEAQVPAGTNFVGGKVEPGPAGNLSFAETKKTLGN
jgi:hypothetical protein